MKSIVVSGLLFPAMALGFALSPAAAAPAAPPAHVHQRPSGYRLAGNSGAPASSLLSKDQILANVRTSADIHVTSTILKTFDRFSQDANTGVTNLEVAPDRMVWEVTQKFDKGLANRGGSWAPSTKVVTAYDAQTGDILGVLTLGKRTGFGHPHGRHK